MVFWPKRWRHGESGYWKARRCLSKSSSPGKKVASCGSRSPPKLTPTVHRQTFDGHESAGQGPARRQKLRRHANGVTRNAIIGLMGVCRPRAQAYRRSQPVGPSAPGANTNSPGILSRGPFRRQRYARKAISRMYLEEDPWRCADCRRACRRDDPQC